MAGMGYSFQGSNQNKAVQGGASGSTYIGGASIGDVPLVGLPDSFWQTPDVARAAVKARTLDMAIWIGGAAVVAILGVIVWTRKRN